MEKLVREKLCYLMALFMLYLVRLQKVEMRELRSHFADGKSPMSVEYEFKINDKNLKYLDRLDLLKRGILLNTW